MVEDHLLCPVCCPFWDHLGFLHLFGLKTGRDFPHFGLQSGKLQECMNVYLSIVSIPSE